MSFIRISFKRAHFTCCSQQTDRVSSAAAAVLRRDQRGFKNFRGNGQEGSNQASTADTAVGPLHQQNKGHAAVPEAAPVTVALASVKGTAERGSTEVVR